LDIDLSTENLQNLCAILNEFALPRAIVDFGRRTVVAWNPRFLEQTGYSEGEIKLAQPEELLILGESWFPLSEKEEGQRVEFIPCAVRRPLGADPAPGYVVRSAGNIGYVMLDVSGSSALEFEQGRIVGREEERNRIVKAYHEEVSSSMIAALFLIETAKSELEEAGLPQAEAVSKASDKLAETTEKIADVLGNTDGNSRT
jgi:PAS domain-containing protein